MKKYIIILFLFLTSCNQANYTNQIIQEIRNQYPSCDISSASVINNEISYHYIIRTIDGTVLYIIGNSNNPKIITSIRLIGPNR